MSSILKAIRKAEDEKRAGDSVAPDLMVDHGQSTPQKKQTFMFPMVAGVVVGAVLVGAGILMLNVGDKSALETDSVSGGRVANNQPVNQEKSAPPQDKAAFVKADIQTLSKPVADGSQKIAKKEIKPSGPVGEVDAIDLGENVESFTLSPKNSDKKTTVKVNRSAKNFTAPPEVQLVVSEIFHQQDNANSMAVVNDLPVMIGTYVDSAIVKAINKNSVEFELDGNSFLVPVLEP